MCSILLRWLCIHSVKCNWLTGIFLPYSFFFRSKDAIGTSMCWHNGDTTLEMVEGELTQTLSSVYKVIRYVALLESYRSSLLCSLKCNNHEVRESILSFTHFLGISFYLFKESCFTMGEIVNGIKRNGDQKALVSMYRRKWQFRWEWLHKTKFFFVRINEFEMGLRNYSIWAKLVT